MTSLRSNLAAKIIAIFLAGVMGFLFVFSIIDIVSVTFLIDEYVTKEALEQRVAEFFLDRSGYTVLEQYEYNDVNNINTYQDANFYISLYDKNANLIVSNYNGQEFWFSKTYIFDFTDNFATLYVKNELQSVDNMSFALEILDFIFAWRSWSILIIVLSAIVLILLITFLICSAGHRKGKDGITLNVIDKIPLELYILFFVFVVICELYLLDYFFIDEIIIFVLVLLVAFDFFLLIGLMMGITTRIKSGTLFSNTILYFVISHTIDLLKTVIYAFKKIINGIPLIWKSVLIIASIVLLEFLVIIAYWNDKNTLIYYWLVEKIILVPCVLLIVLQFKNIKKAIKNLSKGSYENKTDTSYLYFDFKETANDINNISIGLSNAVEDKMKSERFKTQLITNVSHDIKTPLTSIINYVDLIKKEPIENEKLKGYVDVLDRQSKRLKKLTEDLVEASKASSGSISVCLKPIDLNVLLIQVVGEYEDKIQKESLELIVSYSQDPVMIMADGRYLWRILDNLMNNVIKYSQTHTRVYLSLEKIGARAIITLRNISKDKLNISSEELMERFVRGDSSRNTEGSGLGLSIAKSLTELQNGNMQLFVDGDLFKIMLTFDVLDKKEFLNYENETYPNQ